MSKIFSCCPPSIICTFVAYAYAVDLRHRNLYTEVTTLSPFLFKTLQSHMNFEPFNGRRDCSKNEATETNMHCNA